MTMTKKNNDCSFVEPKPLTVGALMRQLAAFKVPDETEIQMIVYAPDDPVGDEYWRAWEIGYNAKTGVLYVGDWDFLTDRDTLTITLGAPFSKEGGAQ